MSRRKPRLREAINAIKAILSLTGARTRIRGHHQYDHLYSTFDWSLTLGVDGRARHQKNDVSTFPPQALRSDDAWSHLKHLFYRRVRKCPRHPNPPILGGRDPRMHCGCGESERPGKPRGWRWHYHLRPR